MAVRVSPSHLSLSSRLQPVGQPYSLLCLQQSVTKDRFVSPYHLISVLSFPFLLAFCLELCVGLWWDSWKLACKWTEFKKKGTSPNSEICLLCTCVTGSFLSVSSGPRICIPLIGWEPLVVKIHLWASSCGPLCFCTAQHLSAGSPAVGVPAEDSF